VRSSAIPGNHNYKPSWLFVGPRDTPYDGGVFIVDIELGASIGILARNPRPARAQPEVRTAPGRDPCSPRWCACAGNQYPFVPPIMRFRSRVWHPNVSSANGAICLDILKDQWSPALTLKTALLSLQALLASPEPNDPQVRSNRAIDAFTCCSCQPAASCATYERVSVVLRQLQPCQIGRCMSMTQLRPLLSVQRHGNCLFSSVEKLHQSKSSHTGAVCRAGRCGRKAVHQ